MSLKTFPVEIKLYLIATKHPIHSYFSIKFVKSFGSNAVCHEFGLTNQDAF